MKSLPTQARARLKRASLIDASTLSFAELGYESTTAKTIAARAGVATGTFYQYFENKNDILRVIAQQRIDLLYTQVPSPTAKLQSNDQQAQRSFTQHEDVETIFKRVLTLIYDFHEQAPELHQVLEQRRNSDSQLADILNQGEAILEQRVRLFVKSFNVESPDSVAFNLFAMAEGLVHRHVFGPSSTSKTEVLTLGAKMLASYFEQHGSK